MVHDINIPITNNGNTIHANDVLGDGNYLFRAICIIFGINDDVYHVP